MMKRLLVAGMNNSPHTLHALVRTAEPSCALEVVSVAVYPSFSVTVAPERDCTINALLVCRIAKATRV